MALDTRENANRIIIQQLDARLSRLENEIGLDVLAFSGPIFFGADDEVRDAVESRTKKKARTKKRDGLAVVLETTGGYVEVAERMADTFRAHYGRVEFIIPNSAMSAGTILVMSGDAIHMDYYSVLGPIDPQIARTPGGGLVPALGYLAQYEKLIAKSAAGKLTTAELSFLLDKFDPAELHAFEQQRELSITLLKKWLVKYKFKDWNTTATNQTPVTPQMREDRARDIAQKLQETERWHTHSRGLSMNVLRDDLNLIIDDFGERPSLKRSIRSYYRLLADFMARVQHGSVVHVPGRYTPLAT